MPKAFQVPGFWSENVEFYCGKWKKRLFANIRHHAHHFACGNVVILCVSAYSQPRCRNQGSRDKSANQASQTHHVMTLVSTLLNWTKYTWSVNFSRTLHIFLSFLIFHFRMSNSCRIPRGFRTQRLGLLVVFTIFKSIFSLTPIHKVWDRPLLKLGYEEVEAVGVGEFGQNGWVNPGQTPSLSLLNILRS